MTPFNPPDDRPAEMCPQCGALCGVRDGLTRVHLPAGSQGGAGAVCPGSEQNPRYAYSDARPLWNGKPNVYFGTTP